MLEGLYGPYDTYGVKGAIYGLRWRGLGRHRHSQVAMFHERRHDLGDPWIPVAWMDQVSAGNLRDVLLGRCLLLLQVGVRQSAILRGIRREAIQPRIHPASPNRCGQS